MGEPVVPKVEQPLGSGLARGAVALVALALWLAGCAGPGGPATPPSAVTATAVAGGVLVEWDGGAGASGFTVLRAEGGADLLAIASVPADARAYVDYTAAPDGAYFYAVAALGPTGPGDPVMQRSRWAVSPRPGNLLSVVIDGSGTVHVQGAAAPVTCTDDCVVGFEPGAEAVLEGEGGELGFAGFGSPCGPHASCRLTMDDDNEVTALFRARVLRLGIDGDAPASVVTHPTDDRGVSACELSPGEECLLGFTYTGGDSLQVSVTAAPLDGSRVAGLEGDCATGGSYCVVDVAGPSRVSVLAARVPVAVADEFAVRSDGTHQVEAPGVLDNDEVGSVAQAQLESFAGPGHVELGADGSFKYSPADGSDGTVSFSYRVRGTHGVLSAPATVTLHVLDRPVAVDDAYATLEDEELRVPAAQGILANDTYLTGSARAELLSVDGHGSVDLDPDGAFTYRPERDATAAVSFAYRVVDALGQTSDPATVSIAITPVNDPPSFELAHDEVRTGRNQLVVLPGFAHGLSPGGGPDEAGQTLRFQVTRRPGPNPNLLENPSISSDGTLRLRTRWINYTPGRATYEVVLIDDGGTANGGSNTSPVRTFTLVLTGGDDD